MSKKTGNIKLSIVIPTFNRLNHLQKCIDSIVKNTKINYEMIVVDGGSTDGTREFLLSLQSNVKILEDEMEGAVKATNKGFREAKGEYVCWLNDDMVALNGAFDKMVEFLENHPDIGMGAFYIHHVNTDEDGEYSNDFIVNSVCGIPYAGCGMLKTSLMKELGFFDESYIKYGVDCAFSLSVWERGLAVIGCEEAKLVHFRVDDHQRELFADIENRDNELLFRKWKNKAKVIRTTIKNNFWSYLTEKLKSEFFFAEGVDFQREKRLIEAERVYLEALSFRREKFTDAYDSQIGALYNLGSIYHQSDRAEKAIETFEKVLHLETERKDQYWAGACYHLGVIYKEREEFTKAKTYFERCLMWNPGHRAANRELRKIEKI